MTKAELQETVIQKDKEIQACRDELAKTTAKLAAMKAIMDS